jgi:hypothetical protein
MWWPFLFPSRVIPFHMFEIVLKGTESSSANATAIRDPPCLRSLADAPIFPLTVRCCGTVLKVFLVVLRNPFLNVEVILAEVTRKGDRFIIGFLVMSPMIMLALESWCRQCSQTSSVCRLLTLYQPSYVRFDQHSPKGVLLEWQNGFFVWVASSMIGTTDG